MAIFRLPSLILALPVFTDYWALDTEVPEHAASRLFSDLPLKIYRFLHVSSLHAQ